MVTYLGSLVQLRCGEGGTLQTNITGVCWECSVYGPHWVCLRSKWHVLPGPTLLRLQGALQWNCPKQALHFVHFPSLSHSGSWVFCKGTDPVGCVFCALPRSEQLRQAGVWQVHCPRWIVCLNCLPQLGYLVSQVHGKSTSSGVLYVSSG